SNYLRRQASGIITPIGRSLNAVGISPDVITVLGLVVIGIGSWRLTMGEWTQAAIILLLGLPFDTLDGAVARAYGKFRPFGAFLDSTLDRYADGLIYGGLAIYFAREDEFLLTIFAIAALHGAMMVSYIRARAESLNIECEVGLFTRVERLLALLFFYLVSLVFGQTAIDIGIIVMAAGNQFTALQRLVYVSRMLSFNAVKIPEN
ncbi:MAG TPA: CDP-alcohol phosphatidyltransferase family protein, partial [Aggregatilineales bacterium]|nr:CDP-alcohol phosphatidyltransferase family protein [Aggregatilineales bacterium]